MLNNKVNEESIPSRVVQHWWGPLLFGIGFMAILLAYSEGIAHLIHRWLTKEEYSHGFFIPLISFYFIWQLRGKIFADPPVPSWYGVALILLASMLLAVGAISEIFIFIHYSLIIALCGFVLSLVGWPVLKIVFLPIFLLVFSIPLPHFIDSSLSWQLQLISSEIGVWVVRLFGIPVFLEGNIIDLGTFKIQVVEACSGLRYLYPLMGLGFIAAYMFRAPFWQRAVIFFSTIPITVLMNSFRIGVIGILINRFGIGIAEGFLHDFEGWIIFMACAAILFLEMWILTFLNSPRRSLHELFGVNVEPLIKNRAWRLPGLSSVIFLSAVGLLVTTTIIVNPFGDREEMIAGRKTFSRFPLHVGEQVATEGSLDQIVIINLGLDDYFIADYQDHSGDLLNLYIAYYASQRKGVSPHPPRVCIPAGGWLITDLSRVELAVGDEERIPVNRVIIKRAGQRQLVYYWFQQRGRSIANEYWMKWYLLLDSLTRNRTDGALVRVTLPVSGRNSLEIAEEKAERFIALIFPKLKEYIPE